MQGYALFLGHFRGRTHFCARLDAELLGDAALVGAQRQVGHHQTGLALADDPVEVEVFPVAFSLEGVKACWTQLDRHGVEPAAAGHLSDGLGTGPGDVCRAQQRVVDAITMDASERLFVSLDGWGR